MAPKIELVIRLFSGLVDLCHIFYTLDKHLIYNEPKIRLILMIKLDLIESMQTEIDKEEKFREKSMIIQCEECVKTSIGYIGAK